MIAIRYVSPNGYRIDALFTSHAECTGRPRRWKDQMGRCVEKLPAGVKTEWKGL